MKSAIPGRMNLGGPQQTLGGDPYTPPDDPKSSPQTGAIKPAATPTQQVAQNVARTAVEGAEDADGAVTRMARPGVASTTASALAAFRKNPTAPGAYENYVAAQKADMEAASAAQIMRERDVRIRAAEHTLTQSDIDYSQKQAQNAAVRATGTLEGYGKASDDVAANDPRFIGTTQRVLADLQKTHDQMADGQVASYTIEPDGAHVTFKDAKTGKVISEQVLGTIGDVRGAVQQMGMATDPANYSKIIALNTATKLSNEIGKYAADQGQAQGQTNVATARKSAIDAENALSVADSTRKQAIATGVDSAESAAVKAGIEKDVTNATRGNVVSTAVTDAQTKQLKAENSRKAQDNIKNIAQAIQDPTATPLLDPTQNAKLKQQAVEAAIYNPEEIEYDKKVPMLDADGKPMISDRGSIITETVKGNRLIDMIEANTPKRTISVPSKDPKLPAQQLPIDPFAAEAVKRYPQIVKDANGSVPAALASVRQSLLAKGFDQRTVDYEIAHTIMPQGHAVLEAQNKAAVTPASVSVKTPPVARGISIGNPRGNPVGTPGTGLPQSVQDTLDNMMKRGLQPAR